MTNWPSQKNDIVGTTVCTSTCSLYKVLLLNVRNSKSIFCDANVVELLIKQAASKILVCIKRNYTHVLVNFSLESFCLTYISNRV